MNTKLVWIQETSTCIVWFKMNEWMNEWMNARLAIVKWTYGLLYDTAWVNEYKACDIR